MARIHPTLIGQLREAGLDVREVAGCWSGAESAELTSIDGLIVHATAGSASASDSGELNVILNGSNTAPPPISQFMLGRTGIVYFVRSGKCFHARNGFSGTRFAGAGNSRLIGIEGCNNNTGEDWSRSYPEYVTLVAVICRHFGWDPFDRVRGHKEHQPGDKSDPTFNMNEFRHQVRARMDELANPTPTPIPAPVPDRKRGKRMTEYLWVARFGTNDPDGTPADGGTPKWAVERPYHPDPARRWEELSGPDGHVQGGVSMAIAGNKTSNVQLPENVFKARAAKYATGGEWAGPFSS
jgi:hypothetical protein